MFRRAWLLSIVACGALLGGASAPAAACGYERWAVKTLGDPQARTLPTVARTTAIADLVGLRAPRDPDLIRDRDAPVETTLWQLRARLIGYRIEADGDLHLILRDPQSGATMVGEVPSPRCTHASAAARFASARQAVAHLGGHAASRRWWWLDYRGATPPLVLVTGYGFFDRLHDVAGQARNGIELHPVVSVQKLSVASSPKARAFPRPTAPPG